MEIKINNQGEPKFPHDSPALVLYPLPHAHPHACAMWARLPGSVFTQCGPHERHVVIEVPALAEPDPRVPNGDAPENLLYPACFRDADEIRAVNERQRRRVREGLADG